MKLKIAYLQSDYAAELDLPEGFTDELRTTTILAHPEVEYYSLEDFAAAFNNDFVSDQGYIAIVSEVESGHLDRTWTKGLPEKEGEYWFYGYRYGVIFAGDEPELVLLDVRKTNNGIIIIPGDGQFIDKSEVEHAWHTPFNILSLGPLPISAEQHETHVKAAAN